MGIAILPKLGNTNRVGISINYEITVTKTKKGKIKLNKETNRKTEKKKQGTTLSYTLPKYLNSYCQPESDKRHKNSSLHRPRVHPNVCHTAIKDGMETQQSDFSIVSTMSNSGP